MGKRYNIVVMAKSGKQIKTPGEVISVFTFSFNESDTMLELSLILRKFLSFLSMINSEKIPKKQKRNIRI